jgi:hypothetical protein
MRPSLMSVIGLNRVAQGELELDGDDLSDDDDED